MQNIISPLPNTKKSSVRKLKQSDKKGNKAFWKIFDFLLLVVFLSCSNAALRNPVSAAILAYNLKKSFFQIAFFVPIYFFCRNVFFPNPKTMISDLA